MKRFVDGVERYTFNATEGVIGKLKVKPATESDAQLLLKAHEFGSNAEIDIQHFTMEGSPALTHEVAGPSQLKLKPYARKLCVAVTVARLGGEPEEVMIELDAEMSKGTRGFELRSADAECPFGFELRVEPDRTASDYAIQILWDRWQGKPYSSLRLVDKVARLSRLFQDGCRVRIEVIQFGDRVEIYSATSSVEQSEALTQTAGSLDLLGKITFVCRELNSRAVFVMSEIPTQEQINSLNLASDLLVQSAAVTVPDYRVRIFPPAEVKNLVLQKPPLPMQLRFSLVLGFGNTNIGEMRLKADFDNYEVTDDGKGGLVVTKSTLPVLRDL